MRPIRWSAVVVILALLVGTAGAQAPAAGRSRDDVFEEGLRGTLAAAAPDAIAAWDEANSARSRGDHAAAIAGYQRVIDLAPRFDAAYRRLAGVLEMAKRGDEARAAAERAFALDSESPYNRMALGGVLLSAGDDEQRHRGLDLLRSGTELAPDDVHVWESYCQSLAQAEEVEPLRQCARTVLRLDPQNMLGHLFSSMIDASEGRLAAARSHLDQSLAAGLDPAVHRRIVARLDAAGAEPPSGMPAWLGTGLWVLALWAACLVALLVTGLVLSMLTLRAASTVASRAVGDRDGAGGGLERRLRRVYGVVIAITGFYFYLSIPVVLLSVVAIGGGFIYAMFAAGRIYPKALIVIGIGVAVTVFAMLRSLFVRRSDADPGERVDLAGEPGLRALLDDVAAVVGTRPVDNVYLTQGTDIAVFERGGVLRGVVGHRERCLILGAGVLDDMTRVQLKSILAHEYGHFRNRDTAGGGFALLVRASLLTMIVRLASSGAAGWYNPAWLFLRAYYAVFLRISQGASRLQEILADRWAAQAYGSPAFVAGFRHVVEQSVRFERHCQSVLREVIQDRRPLVNLYTYERTRPDPLAGTAEGLTAAVREAMTRPATAYDSHPAPAQRIAWVEALSAEGRHAPDDDQPAWSVFRDRDEIQRAMTALVRDAIEQNHGVRIASAPGEDGGDPETTADAVTD